MPTYTRANSKTKSPDPHAQASHFTISIDKVMEGGAHSVTHVDSETDVIEFKDSEDGTTHTRPGLHKPGKLIITKDWTNTPELINWYRQTLAGTVMRTTVSIIQHNDAGTEISRRNYFESWPYKWTLHPLNARSTGHAQESIEISWETHEMKVG